MISKPVDFDELQRAIVELSGGCPSRASDAHAGAARRSTDDEQMGSAVCSSLSFLTGGERTSRRRVADAAVRRASRI